MTIPFYAIILINLVLYGRTIFYGLVIDDIEWDARIRSGQLTHAQLKHLPPYYYIMTSLYCPLFLLNTRLNHLVTLALHTITCVLIALAFNPVAALLFSAHPCNHQTAIWLNGRKYSLFNIVFLLAVISHSWIVTLCIASLFIPFAIHQYASRSHLPYPSVSFHRIVRTVGICLYKLSGLHRPMFIYPYSNTLSIAPYSQPCAERHLSIPLILVCYWLSVVPMMVWPLFVLYALSTWRLMSMYGSVQCFYDYHRRCGLQTDRLAFLKCLYPIIK